MDHCLSRFNPMRSLILELLRRWTTVPVQQTSCPFTHHLHKPHSKSATFEVITTEFPKNNSNNGQWRWWTRVQRPHSSCEILPRRAAPWLVHSVHSESHAHGHTIARQIGILFILKSIRSPEELWLILFTDSASTTLPVNNFIKLVTRIRRTLLQTLLQSPRQSDRNDPKAAKSALRHHITKNHAN
jgi:hypothetical protein